MAYVIAKTGLQSLKTMKCNNGGFEVFCTAKMVPQLNMKMVHLNGISWEYLLMRVLFKTQRKALNS